MTNKNKCMYMKLFLYSAITGYQVSVLLPQDCTQAAKFQLKQGCTRHIIFTAETHNFPTGKSELILMIRKEVMIFIYVKVS